MYESLLGGHQDEESPCSDLRDPFCMRWGHKTDQKSTIWAGGGPGGALMDRKVMIGWRLSYLCDLHVIDWGLSSG